MKKVLTMSMVAAVAVVGNAFAVERDTRMSDIVRLLEDNPEMMAEVESDIATRAVLKTTALKTTSLKSTTGTVVSPKIDSSKIKIADGAQEDTPVGKPSYYIDDNGHFIPENAADIYLLNTYLSDYMMDPVTAGAYGDVLAGLSKYEKDLIKEYTTAYKLLKFRESRNY